MKKRAAWLIVLGVVALAALGYATGLVGNVGIRRVQPVGTRVNLAVSGPVVPGVQTVVHWQSVSSNTPVLFEVRSSTDTFFVGQGRLANGVATVMFPCMAAPGRVGLAMLDADTEQVLGYESVQLLPAGPDCL